MIDYCSSERVAPTTFRTPRCCPLCRSTTLLGRGGQEGGQFPDGAEPSPACWDKRVGSGAGPLGGSGSGLPLHPIPNPYRGWRCDSVECFNRFKVEAGVGPSWSTKVRESCGLGKGRMFSTWGGS